jgi:DNA-binding transcriptional ArsR family regulator
MSAPSGGTRLSESGWSTASAGIVREAPADRFKALSHSDRLRIIEALAAGPKTVTQIAAVVGRPMNTVLRHLRVLRDADVVRCSKRGNSVLYVLGDRDVALLAGLAYRGVGAHLQRVAAMGAANGGVTLSETEAGSCVSQDPDDAVTTRLS